MRNTMLIKGGLVVGEDWEGIADIRITGETIAQVGKDLAVEPV